MNNLPHNLADDPGDIAETEAILADPATMAALAEAEANVLIEDALGNWGNQTLVDASKVVDLLLDLRRLLNG